MFPVSTSKNARESWCMSHYCGVFVQAWRHICIWNFPGQRNLQKTCYRSSSSSSYCEHNINGLTVCSCTIASICTKHPHAPVVDAPSVPVCKNYAIRLAEIWNGRGVWQIYYNHLVFLYIWMARDSDNAATYFLNITSSRGIQKKNYCPSVLAHTYYGA